VNRALGALVRAGRLHRPARGRYVLCSPLRSVPS
jgi:hypothetical protein